MRAATWEQQSEPGSHFAASDFLGDEPVGAQWDQVRILRPRVRAHDLNNLLQIVNSALRLMEQRARRTASEEVSYLIRSAQQASSRASSMARLLTASGEVPAPHAVHIDSVLMALRDLLRLTLGPDIELEFLLCDDPLPVVCRPDRLENAIINLVINARDAMPGGGRLRIETYGAELLQDREGLTQGHYVALAFTDTGCGMTPEAACRAFNPAFTTKPAGTGLGLASVKDFVEQCRGQIVIDSAAGFGTTVRLYLPC